MEAIAQPSIIIDSHLSARWQLIAKAAMDRVLAGLLLVLCAPLFLLITLAIRATSRGHVIFAQRRCGLHGRQFTMYKFRTMVEKAEQLQATLWDQNEMTGPVFKMQEDPRVTQVGRWLRRTSLDELPQLVNVFLGEMSMVGPRPPLPSEVVRYELWQRERLWVTPGLTCIWQVMGRNRIGDFDCWMAMDLYYVRDWSIGLDLWLLWKTIPVVLLGRGAA